MRHLSGLAGCGGPRQAPDAPSNLQRAALRNRLTLVASPPCHADSEAFRFTSPNRAKEAAWLACRPRPRSAGYHAADRQTLFDGHQGGLALRGRFVALHGDIVDEAGLAEPRRREQPDGSIAGRGDRRERFRMTRFKIIDGKMS